MARMQGGMPDIHDYNEQFAVEAAGLLDEFRGLVLEGREAMRILDRTGTVVFEKAADGTGGRPEVQRGELRQLLLDALPAGTIRWGHKVAGTRALGEGRHEVTFAYGSTVVTSLLVGADGACSGSGRCSPTPHPNTSARRSLRPTCSTPTLATANAVGGGSMVANGSTPGRAINAHRESGDTLHAYVEFTEPLDWFAAIDFADPTADRAGVRRLGPELTALITDSDTPPILRPHYTLRPGAGGTASRGRPSSATRPTLLPRTAKAPTSPCWTVRRGRARGHRRAPCRWPAGWLP